MMLKVGFFGIFTFFIFPTFAMIQELEQKAIAAIASGSHRVIIDALEAHKAAIEKEAGSLLARMAPQAGALAADVESGAAVVAAVAGMLPNGGAVAGVANDVEAIAAAAHGASAAAAASTAGGSSSQAAKASALVKAATDGEEKAQAGTGIGSRTLAALVAAGAIASTVVLAYSNWFSTNSSSSENQTAQRVDAVVGSLPSYVALVSTGMATGYYAITNKWHNDQVAAAKVVTQVATNHVNTVTPLLAQVQQSQAPASN